MRRSAVVLLSLLLYTLLGVAGVQAATIVRITTFKLHDFDTAIVSAVGSKTVSILYFKEMATITDAQFAERSKYETIGCNPFYLLKEGQIDDEGYNCRSFFCVGYIRGPKQCKDVDGKSVGGVVEIGRRFSLTTINDTQRLFSDYAPVDQTPEMRSRITELRSLQCSPLYVLNFDVAVGEGYQCEEVGRFPYYSPHHTCITDWRTKNPETMCTPLIRTDEMDIRQDAIERMGVFSGASSARQSSSSSTSTHVSTASTSSSDSAFVLVSFPDVIKGHYGYTAITTLQERGIIRGYSDGTFKPLQKVSRAEFSKLLLAGLHPDEVHSETYCFLDIAEEWFAPFVCAAKRLQWVGGYPDGTFQPIRTLSKAEGIKIVVASLLSLTPGSQRLTTVAGEKWYVPYVKWAVDHKILLEQEFDPMASATRADAAVWMYRAWKSTNEVSSSNSTP